MPATIEKLSTASVVFNRPIHQRFTYLIPFRLRDIVVPGTRVQVPFGGGMQTGYVVDTAVTTAIPRQKPLKEINTCIDVIPLITGELLSIAVWIAGEYGCSEGEALAAILPPRLTLKRSPPVIKDPVVLQGMPKDLQLTPGQKHIVEEITSVVKGPGSRTFVIHGVTGSGKTEIYLRVISHCLSLDRQALYLVPEISMTPHFIGQLEERFGSDVAVWHSHLSTGQRLGTLQKIREGKIRVVLGARSAIFVPFDDIGVIVIDEEHDDSYKQDKKPYYHAHRIARRRAQTHNGVVVLGSATPSMETYARALKGEYTLFRIPERIDNRPLPAVRMVDLKTRARGRGQEIFSDDLCTAIRQRITRREQVILFLNRRGYAPFISCNVCGWVSTCTNCSVSLVYHRQAKPSPGDTLTDMPLFAQEGKHQFAHRLQSRPDPAGLGEKLVCHYCGNQFSLPEVCPACKKSDLRLAGIGTQKVESELKRIFPRARIARLDRDTASKKGYYDTVYNRFKQEDIDILLGTQIVTKGFDFPRVTLVGVIDADTALHVPDFRAAERTFQLITQVAGRAGRSDMGGEVIVQTFYPGHYALRAASRHDYEGFYKHEIGLRDAFGYPPRKKLINCTFRGTQEHLVKSECERFNALLVGLAIPSLEILGPSPALRPLLHRKHRWQIILKSDGDIDKHIIGLFKDFHPKKDVQASLEIEPVSLM